MHDLNQPGTLALPQNPVRLLSTRQQIEALLQANHDLREANQYLEQSNQNLRRELKVLQDYRDRTLKRSREDQM